jgi:hypothetical protein
MEGTRKEVQKLLMSQEFKDKYPELLSRRKSSLRENQGANLNMSAITNTNHLVDKASKRQLEYGSLNTSIAAPGRAGRSQNLNLTTN